MNVFCKNSPEERVKETLIIKDIKKISTNESDAMLSNPKAYFLKIYCTFKIIMGSRRLVTFLLLMCLLLFWGGRWYGDKTLKFKKRKNKCMKKNDIFAK